MSRPKKIDADPNYNEVIARRLARRKWEINNPEKWEIQKRNRRFKSLYGITLSQYNVMLENQKGLCALCGNPPTGIHSSGRAHVLHVDHNHITNKVRGLLCTQCNRGLGYFKDSSELLIKASNYLNDYN
jgi:hypothetical protein